MPAPEESQARNRAFARVIGALAGHRPGIIVMRVSGMGQSSRILATPEFKVNEGTRTELKANSLSGTMLTDFEAKFPQYTRGFSVGEVSRDTESSNPPCSSRQS